MSSFLNASQLAEALGVSCTTVTAWVRNGVITPEIHEGRVDRYDPVKVCATLSECARMREGPKRRD